jgi:hypothetical protein
MAPVSFDRYLENLNAETGYINIRGLSRAGKAKEAGRYPIEQLYIPLTSRGGEEDLAQAMALLGGAALRGGAKGLA